MSRQGVRWAGWLGGRAPGGDARREAAHAAQPAVLHICHAPSHPGKVKRAAQEEEERQCFREGTRGCARGGGRGGGGGGRVCMWTLPPSCSLSPLCFCPRLL
eukprot:3161026-Rhodomonas_salina.1